MSSTSPSSIFFRLTTTLTSSAPALALLLGSVAPGCGGWYESFDPQEASIDELRSQVKSGHVSCRRVVERYEDLRDKIEPQINALVTWNDRLRSDADRLDRIPVWQRGSLHCVPVVVKDNIDVAGLPTSVGAQGLAGTVAPQNAEIVTRLLDAGAIVLGKSNLPDFALDGTNTLSSVAGQTRNPYNLGLSVYGSSGGSAAAIASSLGVLGLGTDTYGSLVQPASATALVTLRPTQGLVARAGIAPLMTLQDMPGPMTRTVSDAAIALELLVDKTQSGKGSQDYTKVLKTDGLRALHIGWDPLVLQEVAALGWQPSKDVVALFNSAVSQLTLAGVNTKQVSAVMPLLPALQDLSNASFACMPVDFKEGINAYLQARGASAPAKSLADVLAGGRFLASARSFLESAQSQSDTIAGSGACQSYLTKKDSTAAAITALMDREELDLLVYPAANQPVPMAGQKPPAGWFGFQILSSPTGLPSLSMTMGIEPTSGAPVGLIFLARKYQEAKLIQAAFGLEAQARARVAPRL